MDHLVLPRGFSPKQLKVPALSSINYDGGDFTGYPERQGWGPRPVAEWQAIFENPPRAFNAFLQRWLYFGLLYFFIGPFDISAFVVDDADNPGMMILSTKALKDCMERRRIQRHRHDELLTALHGCGDILYAFDGQWKSKRTRDRHPAQPERLQTFLMVEQPPNPQHRRVILSECLLWEMALSYIQHPEPEVHGNVPILPQRSVRALLGEKGWCPSDIMPMMEEFTTAGCLFMTHLERPSPGQLHVDKDHAPDRPSCTQTNCRFRRLDESTYTTRHRPDCPGCSDVVAELKILAPVLLQDEIPLIPLQPPSGDGGLSVVPATSDTPYIAISHVWSDGLGNLQRNALPSCQFAFLQRLIHSLPATYPNIEHVWIDTLCVPPDSAHDEPAQAAALKQMRRVYEQTSAVLVLDSWLLSADSSRLSRTEILMRIFNSVWNRRLWTYQEGALAQRLFFQFQDTAHELDSFYQKFLETKDLVLEHTLANSLGLKYKSLRGFKQRKLDAAGDLGAVISGLRFRTTSVATDEALCVAALLNLDMGRIVDSQPEKRMETLWRMLPAVPSELLCYQGEKLTVPGLRWAPPSLLLLSSNVNHRDHYESATAMAEELGPPLACVTPAGLVVRLHGIIMDIGAGRLGKIFMMKDNLHEHHLIHVFARQPQATMITIQTQNGQEKIPAMHPQALYGTGRIAFIQIMHPDLERSIHRRVGILAAITHEEGDVIHARRLCRGFGELQKPSTRVVDTALLDRLYPDQLISKDFAGPPGMVGRDLVVNAAFGQRRESQLWCID